jgi:hypothetical protein
MSACVDLEIGLHRRDVDNYAVELRAIPPESDAEVRLVRSGQALAQFDLERLRGLAADPAAYSQALSESLFADPAVRSAFAEARGIAEALEATLRLRLFVGPGAPELHGLHWETLRDPDGDGPLPMSERVLFSRYLSSQDWRPARLRPRGDLCALVVIANPANLDDYEPGGQPLPPLDVEAELERARKGLEGISLTPLASGGSATLNNLVDHLRDDAESSVDILYLVCHGALVNGEPHLWLEGDGGEAEVVPGSELVARLREMQHLPRLVVLASCQSAGKGGAAAASGEARTSDRGVLAALGPRLAEAGVPAVVAMQGNVTMATMAEFMPVFFRELQQDGQVDRAVAVARGVVRKRPDWWMPVLFMRLKTGRLWYEPGFGGRAQELKEWPALLRYIRKGQCTPILGPGLIESLVGSRQEIARRWAERYYFPMAPQDREDLPQVAQYLAVQMGTMFPRDELGEYLSEEIRSRYGDVLPDDLGDAPLDELITAAGAWQREQIPAEPHRLLARFPLPIYITTDPSGLLADALLAEGRDPQVELCRWNRNVEWLPSVYDEEPNYRPSEDRPLIYHLFGRIQEPDSLVLTEDDYFDYLIGETSNKELIPASVRHALVNTALLFLGFRMYDWNFRVLFRSLMRQEGQFRRRRYPHVAVQIDPEEDRILEPERARRYLESYFQDAHISIYWGSVDDFVRDLDHRWAGGDV